MGNHNLLQVGNFVTLDISQKYHLDPKRSLSSSSVSSNTPRDNDDVPALAAFLVLPNKSSSSSLHSSWIRALWNENENFSLDIGGSFQACAIC